MFVWIIQNYKAAIAIFTAIVTVIIVPLIMSASGFVLSMNQTKANVLLHENRIQSVEKAVYSTSSLLQDMKSSLDRIEDRDYQELKEARRARLEQGR